PAVYPFVGDRAKWIRSVKNIRNQIAHALRERYSFESDIIKLARLTATVEVLLRIVLLRELGFSDDDCTAMTKKHPQWSHLRTVLPVEVPEIYGN
ncbi:MAG: HEPN domain-containing protein, partial [Pyrinomonadaceae bacterium]